jgi:hypothetical protein
MYLVRMIFKYVASTRNDDWKEGIESRLKLEASVQDRVIILLQTVKGIPVPPMFKVIY